MSSAGGCREELAERDEELETLRKSQQDSKGSLAEKRALNEQMRKLERAVRGLEDDKAKLQVSRGATGALTHPLFVPLPPCISSGTKWAGLLCDMWQPLLPCLTQEDAAEFERMIQEADDKAVALEDKVHDLERQLAAQGGAAKELAKIRELESQIRDLEKQARPRDRQHRSAAAAAAG